MFIKQIISVFFVALIAALLTACGMCDQQYLKYDGESRWCEDPEGKRYLYVCEKGEVGDTHYTCCDNPECIQW